MKRARLDPSSVQLLGGSHAYEVSILDDDVLRFKFNDILLPDSTTNEPASHGFVSFKIEQQPDLDNER